MPTVKKIVSIPAHVEPVSRKKPCVIKAPRRNSGLLSEINDFARTYAIDQVKEAVREIEESQKPSSANRGESAKPTPSGFRGAEQNLMQKIGWYWEPLTHDINFFEGMRDSVSILSGAYNKMTDLTMRGFELRSVDPIVNQWFQDNIVDSNVDLYEHVRSSVFELLSLSNSYTRPVYGVSEDNKTTIKALVPVKVTAVRKIRDQNLAVEAYIQLIHRPSEYLSSLSGKTALPSIYLPDEMLCGEAKTQSWYGYGVPPIAALPFVVKMKLQMERDQAEMLHQHVPRIVTTYSPDGQITNEQLELDILDIRNDISAVSPTDSFVLTPDTKIEYIGPNGKAFDPTSTVNHVEMQHFFVLPISPDILGLNQNISPFTAQKRWSLMSAEAESIRSRVWKMFYPAIAYVCKANNIPRANWPKFVWAEIDIDLMQQFATTEEVQISNATNLRNNGFLSQDDSAVHATRLRPNGPVKKSALPGPLEPVGIKADVGPGDKSDGISKIADKDKGPKSDGTVTPKPDPRPSGKRHASFETIAQDAIDKIVGD